MHYWYRTLNTSARCDEVQRDYTRPQYLIIVKEKKKVEDILLDACDEN